MSTTERLFSPTQLALAATVCGGVLFGLYPHNFTNKEKFHRQIQRFNTWNFMEFYKPFINNAFINSYFFNNIFRKY